MRVKESYNVSARFRTHLAGEHLAEETTSPPETWRKTMTKVLMLPVAAIGLLVAGCAGGALLYEVLRLL
jgi:hypothetical protein